MFIRSIGTFILLSVLAAAAPSHATVTWDRTFGGGGNDHCRAVSKTADGGFILGGTVQTASGDTDVRVVRVDGDGNTLWQNDLGGAANDHCLDIVELRLGDILVVGYTGIPPTTYNGLLIRLDESGNELWQRTYGGAGEDLLRAAYETGSGDIVAAGDTYSFGDGRIYLLQTDPEGNLRWQRSLGQADDHAHGVAKSGDGGILLAGWRGDGSTFPEFDALLVKTNLLGTPLFEATFDNGVDDRAYDLTTTSDGQFAMAGVSAGKLSLWKVDNAGGLFWQRTYGEGDVCTSVASTPAGFLLTGYYYDLDGKQFQMVVVRAAGDGASDGSEELGGDLWDIPWAVSAGSNGDYVVAGATTSFGAGGYDWYVARGAIGSGVTSGVDGATPAGLSLSAAPNPFNPQTQILFSMPSPGHARLAIYDVTGRHVSTLVDGYLGGGARTVTWRGDDDAGRGVASGVYFARLEANGSQRVYKLVVTK